jgi:hypothetical protein
MTKEEILGKLCYYDSRNPENQIDDDDVPLPKAREGCYCDNCFYGRTKLADELLKYIEIDERIQK